MLLLLFQISYQRLIVAPQHHNSVALVLLLIVTSFEFLKIRFPKLITQIQLYERSWLHVQIYQSQEFRYSKFSLFIGALNLIIEFMRQQYFFFHDYALQTLKVTFFTKPRSRNWLAFNNLQCFYYWLVHLQTEHVKQVANVNHIFHVLFVCLFVCLLFLFPFVF